MPPNLASRRRPAVRVEHEYDRGGAGPGRSRPGEEPAPGEQSCKNGRKVVGRGNMLMDARAAQTGPFTTQSGRPWEPEAELCSISRSWGGKLHTVRAPDQRILCQKVAGVRGRSE